MSDLSSKKTTKRQFLKILGVSSASLLSSGALADELLAKARDGLPAFGAKIPVAVTMKPNALQLGRCGRFSSIITFPKGYRASHIDISTVKCEGAHALDSIFHANGRTIIILFDSISLRSDLPCGYSTPFSVTGNLSNGSPFEGSGEVAVIGADQNVIYHTSTRRRRSCRACKGHAVNRIYSSRQAADEDRAHLACNCGIVEERINWQDYVKAFWPDSLGGTIVYDRRWDWPLASPAGLDLEY